MANVKNNAASQETQRRLLEAAGEVFAEHGFHSATIKEITDRAGASIASVNYHFNDKRELYSAVLAKIVSEALAIIPPAEVLQGTPEARFRAAVRHMTLAMLGRGKPAWERVLMAREFASASPALDELFDRVCVPVSRVFSGIIAEITRRDADDPEVGMAAANTFAISIYYLHHRSHLGRLHPQIVPPPDAETIASYIADFALAGLASLKNA